MRPVACGVKIIDIGAVIKNADPNFTPAVKRPRAGANC